MKPKWFKKPNQKRVWFCEDGKIITDESYTVRGMTLKFYFCYANHEDRDKGINFATGQNLKHAKELAHDHSASND
jgi:hypothetical protein